MGTGWYLPPSLASSSHSLWETHQAQSPVYIAAKETSKYRAWSLSARSSCPPDSTDSLLRLALGLEGLDHRERWVPKEVFSCSQSLVSALTHGNPKPDQHSHKEEKGL